MKSVWIFKESNLPWYFLKTVNWFNLSKGCCYHELLRNVYRLPSFCAQQCADEGVGLYTRHNLYRTDNMKNGKQDTAYSQLTA